MHAEFRDQVVWITGASSGIGAALAEAFADQGARLVLSARDTARLEALREALPTEALVLPLDLTDPGAIAAAAAQALAWQGRIDVLVNNAGVSLRAEVLDTSMATARRVMEVNFFGAAALTAAVAPAMVTQGRGHIVNITSVAAYVAAPLRAYYSASKHALRAWSNTLRAELGGTGVEVTMICPGYVKTDISQRALDGHGAPLRRTDPHIEGGLPPALVAARTLQAVARSRREVYLGRTEITAIFLQRFTPGLVAWVLPDQLPRSDAGLLGVARRLCRWAWGVAPWRLQAPAG